MKKKQKKNMHLSERRPSTTSTLTQQFPGGDTGIKQTYEAVFRLISDRFTDREGDKKSKQAFPAPGMLCAA